MTEEATKAFVRQRNDGSCLSEIHMITDLVCIHLERQLQAFKGFAAHIHYF